jgi:hypothetical protein
VVPSRGVHAVQRPLLQGDHHDVGITELQDTFDVATCVGVPELADDGDVLLRHRPRSISLAEK